MARSLADIDADLAVAYASRRQAMQSSSYTTNGRSMSRDLRAIDDSISKLEAERTQAVISASGGGVGPFIGSGQVLM